MNNGKKGSVLPFWAVGKVTLEELNALYCARLGLS